MAVVENRDSQRQRASSMRFFVGGFLVVLTGLFSACHSGSPSCPMDDGDPCTLDECESGVAVNEYLGDGHPCFVGGLQGACNKGSCDVPCVSASQCNDGFPCTRDECHGGICVIEPDDAQTAGEDGNACTEEHCLDGEVVSWPKPEGSACGGGASECVAGVCAQCAVPADCGFDTECSNWRCEAEKCVAIDKPYGQQTFANNVAGDCRQWVCDGKGGVVIEPAPYDTPISYDQCFSWVCVGFTPLRVPKVGDKCIQNDGFLGICASTGSCVQCVQDLDCGVGARCDDEVCVKCGDAQPNGDEICGGSCGACKGTACLDDTDCASGQCVETNAIPAKICCNFACDGTCQQCGTIGSNLGQCTPVPTGQQDDSCNLPGMACAGAYCKWKVGYPCVQNTDCISGKCANGTCLP